VRDREIEEYGILTSAERGREVGRVEKDLDFLAS
jgi:hypothetical protein